MSMTTYGNKYNVVNVVLQIQIIVEPRVKSGQEELLKLTVAPLGPACQVI